MGDMAAHPNGRGTVSRLQLLSRLEWESGDGAALDRRQKARWRHGHGGRRRRYQNAS
jgi:hypothetical protein